MGVGGRKSRLTPGEVKEMLDNIVRNFSYEASDEKPDIEKFPEEGLESQITGIEVSIIQERLRQARYSFRLSFIMTTVSALLSLASIVLLLVGSNTAAGSVGVGAGLSSIAVSMQAFRQANDKLDELVSKIDEE